MTRADALPACDHPIEGGRRVVDGTDIVHGRNRCALVDLQARTPPDVVLAVDIEARGRDRDGDHVVLAEPATHLEVEHVEVVRLLADPQPEVLGQARAWVTQHIAKALRERVRFTAFLSAGCLHSFAFPGITVKATRRVAPACPVLTGPSDRTARCNG